LVVPNILGICVFSPPLDANGNSVKGMALATKLAQHFGWNIFEILFKSPAIVECFSHKEQKTEIPTKEETVSTTPK